MAVFAVNLEDDLAQARQMSRVRAARRAGS
jgi:hypothetical protein